MSYTVRVTEKLKQTPSKNYINYKLPQESQESREARLDRQRLRTNHLTHRQRWVPLLVTNIFNICF